MHIINKQTSTSSQLEIDANIDQLSIYPYPV